MPPANVEDRFNSRTSYYPSHGTGTSCWGSHAAQSAMPNLQTRPPILREVSRLSNRQASCFRVQVSFQTAQRGVESGRYYSDEALKELKEVARVWAMGHRRGDEVVGVEILI